MTGSLRLRGVLLGLAGTAVFGWGLHHLMSIGSCGGVNPPCPDDAWPYFLALPAGLITTIVAVFLGGGVIAFVGIFATAGVVSLLVAADGGVDGDTTFPLVFGLSFLVFGSAPLLVLLWARGRARAQARIRATGTKAIATVVAVSDTGVTINDNPHLSLRLQVEPRDGTPSFEIEKGVTVSRIAIPRPGDRYDAAFDPSDRDELVLGDVLAPVPAAPDPPPALALAQPVPADWVAQLAQLNDLRLKGALSDTEFEAAKDRLLGT